MENDSRSQQPAPRRTMDGVLRRPVSPSAQEAGEGSVPPRPRANPTQTQPRLTTPATPSEPLLPAPHAQPRPSRQSSPQPMPVMPPSAAVAPAPPVTPPPSAPRTPVRDDFAAFEAAAAAPAARPGAPAKKRRGLAFIQAIVMLLVVLGVAAAIVAVYLRFYA